MKSNRVNPASLRTWAEIDLKALTQNLKTIRQQLTPDTFVLGVVKADAYGHGMIPITQSLAKQGVRHFGVASVSEALPLRASGFKGSILLLSAALPSEYPEAIQNRLILTLSSLQEAQQIAKISRRLKERASVHLKINTGMNRLGASAAEAELLISFLQKCSDLQWTGLWTHFACADSDSSFTQRQWNQFIPWTKRFPHLLLHAANSAAMLRSKDHHLHAVRAGISLYGYPPLSAWNSQFQPVLSWKCRITRIEKVPAGQSVSYGATYRTPKRQRLATLCVGYADGYSRLLSNRGNVLLHGQSAPIRGRVTMDQILVDVSRIPRAKMGDTVTLIGREGKHLITAHDLALQTGTIPYEILCGIGNRVVRVYSK